MNIVFQKFYIRILIPNVYILLKNPYSVYSCELRHYKFVTDNPKVSDNPKFLVYF